jgi:hypothetical protein
MKAGLRVITVAIASVFVAGAVSGCSASSAHSSSTPTAAVVVQSKSAACDSVLTHFDTLLQAYDPQQNADDGGNNAATSAAIDEFVVGVQTDVTNPTVAPKANALVDSYQALVDEAINEGANANPLVEPLKDDLSNLSLAMIHIESTCGDTFTKEIQNDSLQLLGGATSSLAPGTSS